MILYRKLKSTLPGLLLVGAFCCTDQPLTLNDSESNSEQSFTIDEANGELSVSTIFTKSVGATIDGSKGERWIENYKKTHGDEGIHYTISSDLLKGLLGQQGCNGISLHYAVDAQDKLHIIPVAIHETGVKIKTDVLATGTGIWSWDAARLMMDRYEGRVHAHYFGANTFGRLFRNSSSATVRITMALDDEGNPQLLLSDDSEVVPMGYEDDSFPCPSVCPKN